MLDTGECIHCGKEPQEAGNQRCDDCTEAHEWGQRAGNAGMPPAVSPYAKDNAAYPAWLSAYKIATQQRIAHGGASPF